MEAKKEEAEKAGKKNETGEEADADRKNVLDIEVNEDFDVDDI